MLLELSEFCHYVTRVKISERALEDPAISEFERRRGAEIAKTLSMGALSRAWTLIMNGYEDVKDSPRPLASLEMALIRIAYAADLPSPEEALRKLAEGGAVAAPRPAPALRRLPGARARRWRRRLAAAPALPPSRRRAAA